MIISFGYDKSGPPHQASKVFDVRDLSHDTKSKWFTAREQEIRDYVKQHPKQTVAVGCDKGNHRSVTLVDRIAKTLRVSKFHKDK